MSSWPEAASTVQLLVPDGWYCSKGVGRAGRSSNKGGGGRAAAGAAASSTTSSSNQFLCHFEYCKGGDAGTGKGGGLLKIVSSDESRTVLDVVRVDDVIGASVEVTLASTTTTVGVSNDNNDNDQEMEHLVSSRRKPAGPPSETLVDNQGHATLHLYCYPKLTTRKNQHKTTFLQRIGLVSSKKPGPPPVPDPSGHGGDDDDDGSVSTPLPRVAAHRALVLAPVEDLSNVQVLVQAIQQLAKGEDDLSKGGRRREAYLLLVNPVSGTGKAESETRTFVVPMLEQAGIDANVIITQHPGHAYDICRRAKDKLNDNKKEEDDALWDGVTGIVVVGGDGVFHEVVNALAESGQLSKYKMGMIPCGTGSGLAATTSHANREVCNVLSSTFTICKGNVVDADTSKYCTTNQSHTSFLTFSWGLVADVDMESECIRWLGTIRFDLWAVYRMVFLRTYRGRLSYTTRPVTSLPALADPVPDDWTTVEDEFILFWASQVTHASMGFYHSPFTQMGDGHFQIMMVRKPMSRFQMMRILLSIDSGEHVQLKGVEFVKCTAYRLEPVGSYNVIDGEKVESGPVQAHVVPKSLRVFGRRG